MEKEQNVLEELSNYIFTSKYSRYLKNEQRRETWHETVRRVENMHLKKFKSLDQKDLDEIKWAFDLVRDKRIVPSMRSLQFGGRAVEAHNGRIFNCAVRHIDSIRAFSESFYLLLCGCGLGIGLHPDFLKRIPDLVDSTDKTGSILSYTIDDSIEGWSDSIGALLSCYVKNTPFTGRKIVFDFSKIRPAGSPLKTGGGKAPGHEGLKRTLNKIKEHLDFIIEVKNQKRLKSIDVYDILMHLADAVLSGGIRRSATSVIFQKDDIDMIEAKTDKKVEKFYSFSHIDTKIIGGNEKKIFEGKILFDGRKYEVEIEEWEKEKLEKESLIGWHRLFPQRGRSNNSILLLRKDLEKEEFRQVIERTKQYGEPGFVFANNEYSLFNPCFEINFLPINKNNDCGVQFCNLTSINGALIKNKKDFLEAAKAAAIIGTLQATYTDFNYLSNVAKELTEEEALLGVSITGMMDNPDVLFNYNYQKEAAELVVKTNEKWAKKLGINPAARNNCIKPEGTSSLVLKSGSGIHAHKHRKYFRRVQANKLDPVYQFYKLFNSGSCEESVWSANKTDDVITFPIEIPDHAIIQDDLTALKHLDYIRNTQINWVRTGTSKYNKKDLEHNVSCTINVKQDEWDDVLDYIFKYKDDFSAVSMLPDFGDTLYAQAPWEAVRTPEQEERFNKLKESFVHTPYTKLVEDDDHTSHSQEAACAGGACETNI